MYICIGIIAILLTTILFIGLQIFRAHRTIDELKIAKPRQNTPTLNDPGTGSVFFEANPYYGSEEDGPTAHIITNPQYS